MIDTEIDEHIQFWQNSRKYVVKTIFLPDDSKYTYVAVKWVLDKDGNYLGLNGLVYSDSTTLEYCGCKFILVS